MHGFVIINKPLGASSAQVVGRVKRLVGKQNKVGHAGTLDPLASGVLPLAIGEATKVVQFLIDASKVYEFEVSWGQETTTDDAEGEVVASSEQRAEISELEKILPQFTGEIEQLPPSYSALKINGRRAYDLARAGEEVKLAPRKVTVYSLEILEYSQNATKFRMKCSKGTYVRSIARDIGRKLGSYGYVTVLNRTQHGAFGIDRAITLESFEEMCTRGEVSKAFLPLEEVLDGIPALPLDEFEEKQIRNGVALDKSVNSEMVTLLRNEKLVAIAVPQGDKLQPIRVFNH